MNYATDRLDRKLREGTLKTDYSQAFVTQNHSLLAQTLRDAGCNAQAVYHYAASQTVGDLGQMLELAGRSWDALQVLLMCRRSGGVEWCKEEPRWPQERPSFLECIASKDPLTFRGHCGCGNDECGSLELTFDVFNLDVLQQTEESLEKRCGANDIWQALTLQQALPIPGLPEILQVWNNQSDFSNFDLPLQLLYIKLLFLHFPRLAMVTCLQVTLPPDLPPSLKSHRAYYLFIRSLCLGRVRIKLGRRKPTQIPLWDDALTKHPRLYYIGDSHILSLAWRSIRVNDKMYQVHPCLVTGLKAWHVCNESRFFTTTTWYTTLSRLQGQTVLVSAGEIDVREGLNQKNDDGGSLDCHEPRLRSTVNAFCQGLLEASEKYRIRFGVVPVAPHAYNNKGRVHGRQARRETTRMWNTTLREYLPRGNVYFLDYEESLGKDGILHPELDADSTHMNAGFVPFLEQAIEENGLL